MGNDETKKARQPFDRRASLVGRNESARAMAGCCILTILVTKIAEDISGCALSKDGFAFVLMCAACGAAAWLADENGGVASPGRPSAGGGEPAATQACGDPAASSGLGQIGTADCTAETVTFRD